MIKTCARMHRLKGVQISRARRKYNESMELLEDMAEFETDANRTTVRHAMPLGGPWAASQSRLLNAHMCVASRADRTISQGHFVRQPWRPRSVICWG